VFYFKVEELRSLLITQLGMEEVELKYIRRQYCNRGDKMRRRRCWVQGEFRVPMPALKTPPTNTTTAEIAMSTGYDIVNKVNDDGNDNKIREKKKSCCIA